MNPVDLKKLNSITKYPSILTYHQLGEKGRLTEELSEQTGFAAADEVFVYEKVDGENARIILLHADGEADYLIGSREELLFAKGDRIGNPYGNIAEFFTPIAERLTGIFSGSSSLGLTVIYQESYGGKTKAAKNYTGTKTQGYRVFDVFSLNADQLQQLLALPLEKIAEWREHGGQPFYDEQQKRGFIQKWGLEAAPLVDTQIGSEFPVSLTDTFGFLKQFEETRVGLDVSGKSEGIIVRTADRKLIRKIRFEDYERTFRSGKS